MRRQRILTVVDSLGYGGHGRLVVALHARFSRSRFELRVACLTEPSPLARDLRDLKVTVHELGLQPEGTYLEGVVALRRLVSTMGIDLVHTYGPLAGSIGRLASVAKVPIVCTLDDPGGEDRRRPGLPAWLERRSVRRLARRALVTSRSAQARWRERGVETEVVPLAVDVERLQARLGRCDREQARRVLGLGSQATVYLHVGRFERGRGQDLLLEGFRLALTEQPGLRLLLAGTGPELTHARGLADELDLQDAVVFLGEVADVVPLYRACDAFVLPGRWDGESTALLEAMTAGVPAVIHDGGGDPEIATRETALFVDAGRGEDLARAMLTLERDPELRRRLGAAGRRRASVFDAPKACAELEAIYDALLRADLSG